MFNFPKLACVVLLIGSTFAQAPESSRPAILATLPEMTVQWRADVGSLERLYSFPLSSSRNLALTRLHGEWNQRLASVDFEGLARRDQIDWLLLSEQVRFALEELQTELLEAEQIARYLKHSSFILPLLEARSHRELPNPRQAAEAMHAATQEIDDWQSQWEEEHAEQGEDYQPDAPLMRKVARVNGRMHRAMQDWYLFGAEYHPEFTWWCETPWEQLNKALEGHSKFLEETIGGIDPKDDDRLIGNPIGLERLLSALKHKRIAYTPAELITIAEREFAWCDKERARAATELGLDGDWRAAQNSVRSIQVPPRRPTDHDSRTGK